MKKLLFVLSLGAVSAITAKSQILLSGGLTYSENFDSLASSSAGTTVPWTDNTTVPGWYASRAILATGGAYGPTAYTSYRVAGGENNSGWIYSFGTNNGVGPVTDRAFGSISSGSTGTNAWGLRIQNDTANSVGNVLVSYTGEEWRNGGNATTQTMVFTYQVSSTPFSSPISALANDPGFSPFAALDFLTPTTGATASVLDGNAPANRTVFTGILLSGVVLAPGQELFLRWYDVNDAGNDHGFGVDDFSASFSVVPEPSVAMLGGVALLGLIGWRRSRR